MLRFPWSNLEPRRQTIHSHGRVSEARVVLFVSGVMDTCFDLKPAEGADKMSGDTELTLEVGPPRLHLRVL